MYGKDKRCVERRKSGKKTEGAIHGKQRCILPGAMEARSILMTQTNKHILVNHNNDLMEKVVELSNTRKAIERVESNKGAAGADNMQVKELRSHLRANWVRIKQELLDGTYKPTPVRRVQIPKPDGGVRQLGIPTVTDRFIQQAIQQVLTPILEPEFSESSYGFRPGRSARQAVRKAQEYIKYDKRIVVDIDLEKFFDSVNHDILMTKVTKYVHDKRIHKVIRRYLQAGVMLNGCCVATEEGTPQGGPLSPLLANLMLNDLDHELTRRGHSFVRYADDCNIYVSSKRAGQRVYQSVKKLLSERLKLKINEEKSAVGCPSIRKFLGFSFTSCGEAKLRLAPRTREKFKEHIRKLTNRNWGIPMQERLKKLNPYLLGWIGYFGIVQQQSVFRELDGWIRRRMRMCMLKQWKDCKTKLRNLIALGVPAQWAGCIAFSRKKYWRLAHTKQVNMALSNAYWRKQGLVALVEKNCGMLKSA
jgi:group II intron reverse transcriptase/maturase